MLDEKLRGILTSCVNKAYDVMDSKSWHDPYPEPIAQIKQAFMEEGYIQAHTLPRGIYSASGKSFIQISAGQAMTGQEWFDQFEKELNSGLPLPKVMDIWVRKCAEKAANLERNSK